MPEIPAEWKELAITGGTLLGALLAGWLVHRAVWWTGRRIARRTSNVLDDSLVRHCRRPTLLILPTIAVYVALPTLRGPVEPDALAAASGALMVALIFAVAFLLIRLTSVAEDVIAARYDVDAADNLEARAIHTQFGIIRKIVTLAIGVFAVASVLMGFEDFRRIGTGLLASAGLAGLVIGFAAQKALSNLLAGIQLAITQPIRIDDVVIVEGEWGRVEEITLTYVVVRIWDLRRLVVPIGYFLEKPFENWTRVSADLLGTIELHLDYAIPIEAVRAELRRICEQSPHWDGEVCNVQVTDAGEQTLEVRALISAADASKQWELRCEVREKLVAFVQEKYPDCLPRLRAEIDPARAGEGRDGSADAIER